MSKSSIDNTVSAIPFAGVQVCLPGGGGTTCISPDNVTLFTDLTFLTPLSNPFFADSNGNYNFCTAAGLYKIIVSGAGLNSFANDNVPVPADFKTDVLNSLIIRGTSPGIPSLKIFDALDTSSTQLITCTSTPGCFFLAGATNTEIRTSRIASVFSTAGGQQNASHIVLGTCTLGTNCAVTFAGSATFTSSVSYRCTASDSTAANAVRVNQTAGNAVTFTGTGTDVLNFTCIGN